MRSFINNFLIFLKLPHFKKKIDNKFLSVIYFLFFTIITSLLLFIIYGITNYYDIELEYLIKFKKLFKDKYFILKVVLIIPVLEEFLFRAILKPKKTNLSLFVFAFTFYVLKQFQLESLVVFIISLIISV